MDPIVLQPMQDRGTAPVFCVPADFSRLRDRPAAPPANSEYDWVAVETASMAPVVGEVRDWGEAISGYDIYGNPLSWWERGITVAAGMVPYVPGSWGRGAASAMGRYGDNATEWAIAWWRRQGGRRLPFNDADRVNEVNCTLDLIERGGPFPYDRMERVSEIERAGFHQAITANTPYELPVHQIEVRGVSL